MQTQINETLSNRKNTSPFWATFKGKKLLTWYLVAIFFMTIYVPWGKAIPGTNAMRYRYDGYYLVWDTPSIPPGAIDYGRIALEFVGINALFGIVYLRYRNKESVSLEDEKTDEKKWYNLGYDCIGRKDFDGAIKAFSKVISINPQNTNSYLQRGNAFYSKGLYDSAIVDYDRVIAIYPKSLTAYKNRGIIYHKKGFYDIAIENYTNFININPNSADIFILRGLSYMVKGSNFEAIDDFTNAINIDPQNVDAYYNRGLAYAGEDFYDNAINDYEQTTVIDSRYSSAYFNKAITYDRLNHYDKAIEAYNDFLQYAIPKQHEMINIAKKRLAVLES